MRVLVTGATGFVGAHTARTLHDAGHEVKALVRSRERLRTAMQSLSMPMPEHVVGDMTARSDVEAAVDGTDAVIHCGAVVSLERGRAEEMLRANVSGLTNVLHAATDAALDPIIYTSSTSALFTPGTGPLTVDHPPSRSADPYAASKAACETVARDFQQRDAPLTVAYPSGVLGPPAGLAFGETAEQMSRFVAVGVMPTRRAALSLIDVRDLSAVLSALVVPGRGPRRVMSGGHLVTMEQLAGMLRSLTGRRIPISPTPPALLRSAGRGVDALRHLVHFSSAMSAEAMTLVTEWKGTSDSDLQSLGIELRSAEQTLRDSLVAWHDAGLISSRQLGRCGRDDFDPSGHAGSANGDAGGRGSNEPPKGFRLPAGVSASRPFRAVAPRVIPRFHRAALKVSGGRTILDSHTQPMLMLTATGARSGIERTTPLATVPRPDGTFVVVGSNFASEAHPAWTANLIANPSASVVFQGTRLNVSGRLLRDDEVTDIWPELVRWYPNWEKYRQITDRDFRVFLLEPVPETKETT